MTDLETLGAIASIVTTAVTAVTLIVLIVYTVETHKLRLEAQRQNEHSMMPIVVFQSVYIRGQSVGTSRPVIRNLGPGPSFNVRIDSIPILGKLATFEHPRTLASGQQEFVAISGLREATQDSLGGHDDGKIHHIHQLLKDLQSDANITESKAVITYTSATGKKYRTNFTMDHKTDDAESFVLFDGMEAI